MVDCPVVHWQVRAALCGADLHKPVMLCNKGNHAATRKPASSPCGSLFGLPLPMRPDRHNASTSAQQICACSVHHTRKNQKGGERDYPAVSASLAIDLHISWGLSRIKVASFFATTPQLRRCSCTIDRHVGVCVLLDETCACMRYKRTARLSEAPAIIFHCGAFLRATNIKMSMCLLGKLLNLTFSVGFFCIGTGPGGVPLMAPTTLKLCAASRQFSARSHLYGSPNVRTWGVAVWMCLNSFTTPKK